MKCVSILVLAFCVAGGCKAKWREDGWNLFTRDSGSMTSWRERRGRLLHVFRGQ